MLILKDPEKTIRAFELNPVSNLVTDHGTEFTYEQAMTGRRITLLENVIVKVDYTLLYEFALAGEVEKGKAVSADRGQ
jgi:hypothetical protein